MKGYLLLEQHHAGRHGDLGQGKAKADRGHGALGHPRRVEPRQHGLDARRLKRQVCVAHGPCFFCSALPPLLLEALTGACVESAYNARETADVHGPVPRTRSVELLASGGRLGARECHEVLRSARTHAHEQHAPNTREVECGEATQDKRAAFQLSGTHTSHTYLCVVCTP